LDVEFERKERSCLRLVKREIQTQEESQELRITEDMPDIGSVLCAWGQPLIRGKQWRDGCMEVSGGITAFVLYAPEDGSHPRSIQTWMPFQMRWDLPETEHDGTIYARCHVNSVNARSASARKLIVRADISVLAEATVEEHATVCVPGNVPEDVQLLRQRYPVCIPTEAGEKAFTLEQNLTIPTGGPKIDKIVRYQVQPELIEEKVMSDKIVFRGTALLHVLYQTREGELHSHDFEVPFSQYAQLEQEHEQNAQGWAGCVLTGLELDKEFDNPDALQLKAGLLCQYRIFDRPVIEVVEDAYSTVREISPVTEELLLPVMLDRNTEHINPELSIDVPGTRLVDIACYPGELQLRSEEDGALLQMQCLMQSLIYNADGVLQSVASRWSDTRNIPADGNTVMQADWMTVGKPQGSISGSGGVVRGEMALETVSYSSSGIRQVTGVDLGQQRDSEEERPSLILQKMGTGRLWDLAKRCGSTMEAIRAANALEGEPDSQQMLIIPVL